MTRKHDLQEKARSLAKRLYAEEISRDETTDGQPIYLIAHPELPGCMTQGATIEEQERVFKRRSA